MPPTLQAGMCKILSEAQKLLPRVGHGLTRVDAIDGDGSLVGSLGEGILFHDSALSARARFGVVGVEGPLFVGPPPPQLRSGASSYLDAGQEYGVQIIVVIRETGKHLWRVGPHDTLSRGDHVAYMHSGVQAKTGKDVTPAAQLRRLEELDAKFKKRLHLSVPHGEVRVRMQINRERPSLGNFQEKAETSSVAVIPVEHGFVNVELWSVDCLAPDTHLEGCVLGPEKCAKFDQGAVNFRQLCCGTTLVGIVRSRAGHSLVLWCPGSEHCLRPGDELLFLRRLPPDLEECPHCDQDLRRLLDPTSFVEHVATFGGRVAPGHALGPAPALKHKVPLVVHFGFAEPLGLKGIGISDEVSRLALLQEQCLPHYDFQIRVLALQRGDRVRSLAYAPMLHLSLHANPHTGDLALEQADGFGGMELVPAQEFARDLVPDPSLAPRFVFVSGCGTEPLGRLLASRGVQDVVCIREGRVVVSMAARVFSQQLYVELARGSPLSRAFESAQRETERRCGAAQSSLFLLLSSGLPEQNAENDYLVRTARRPDREVGVLLSSKEAFRPVGSVPGLGCTFVCDVRYGAGGIHQWEERPPLARGELLVQVMVQLLRHGKRAVRLWGPRQAGKAALALRLAQFFGLPSRAFSAGVAVADLRDVDGHASLEAVTAEVRDAALKSGAQVGPDVGLHASLREWSTEARKSSSALMLLVLQGVDCKEAHTELLCEVGKTLHFVEQLRVVITSNDTDPSVPWTLNNYHAHPVEVGDLQHSEAVKIAASMGVSELQAKALVQSLYHNGPLLAGTVREASLNFRGEVKDDRSEASSERLSQL